MTTITDKEEIRKALCMPKSMPDSFLPKELSPTGSAKFIGDNMPIGWSVNDQFEIGKTYPVYYQEDGVDSSFFVIGNDGKGKKIVPNAWSEVDIVE